MAKLGSVQKNNKRKAAVKRLGAKRNSLKAAACNKELTLEERFGFAIRLAALPRDSSPTRVRNRCSLTGRPRGYDSTTGISRIALRRLAAKGLLPGVVKASW